MLRGRAPLRFYLGLSAALAATTTLPARSGADVAGSNSQAQGLVTSLEGQCAATDPRLRRVAEQVLAERLSGRALPGAAELEARLRAQGSTLVWPAARYAHAKSGGEVLAALEASRQQTPAEGEETCGAAAAFSGGRAHAVLVRADVWARLEEELPRGGWPGQWLTLRVRFLVPVSHARVVVAGGGEAPLDVPASLRPPHLEAQIPRRSTGSFTVQVLADGPRGPRPVLAAELGLTPAAARAPGEDRTGSTPEEALRAMLHAVRETHDLPPLRSDAELDAVARAHTRAMRTQGLLAHDTGAGSLERRARAAGVLAQELGENVAHADALFLAHRVLYASPAHRSNLLGARWERVGVAVERDDDGSLWVTQVFAR